MTNIVKGIAYDRDAANAANTTSERLGNERSEVMHRPIDSTDVSRSPNAVARGSRALAASGMFAAALLIGSVQTPVFAQNAGGTVTETPAMSSSTANTDNTDHDHHDWGWLGLLGLAGLAGLRKQRSETTIRTSGTGTR